MATNHSNAAAQFDGLTIALRALAAEVGLKEGDRGNYPYLERAWFDAGRAVQRLMERYTVLGEQRLALMRDCPAIYDHAKFMILPNRPLMLTAGEPS